MRNQYTYPFAGCGQDEFAIHTHPQNNLCAMTMRSVVWNGTNAAALYLTLCVLYCMAEQRKVKLAMLLNKWWQQIRNNIYKATSWNLKI